MAKSKSKDRERKRENKSEGGVASATIDATAVGKLSSRMKKLMGEPEHVFVKINNQLELTATLRSGNVALRDAEAVKAAPRKTIEFAIPFSVLNAATSGRGELKVERDGNRLNLTGTRYKAELNVEQHQKAAHFETIKGQDSTPLKNMLKEAAYMLKLWSHTANAMIDVHFRWGKNGIVAGVADNAHAIVVRGPSNTKNKHEVTLPLSLAQQLAEIGGQFDIGSNRVRAQSELGSAILNQVSEHDSIVPLDTIVGIVDRQLDWQAEINSDELSTLLQNLKSVVEGDQRIVFRIDKDTLSVDGTGRYGKIKGTVDIATTKGKAPKEIQVSPGTFHDITGKVSGLLKIGISLGKDNKGNLLRIEPAEQGEWKFAGVVLLLSS